MRHFELFSDDPVAELNAYHSLVGRKGYSWVMATNIINRAKERARILTCAKDLNVSSAMARDLRNSIG